MTKKNHSITCKRLFNAVDWMQHEEYLGYLGCFTLVRKEGKWTAKKVKRKA